MIAAQTTEELIREIREAVDGGIHLVLVTGRQVDTLDTTASLIALLLMVVGVFRVIDLLWAGVKAVRK